MDFHIQKMIRKEIFPIPFGKFIVLKLMKPFTGYGRNVILENFFTSVSLATKRKQKELLLLEPFIEINKKLSKFVKQIKNNMACFLILLKLYKLNQII